MMDTLATFAIHGEIHNQPHVLIQSIEIHATAERDGQ